jgi:hypothetical protein
MMKFWVGDAEMGEAERMFVKPHASKRAASEPKPASVFFKARSNFQSIFSGVGNAFHQ